MSDYFNRDEAALKTHVEDVCVFVPEDELKPSKIIDGILEDTLEETIQSVSPKGDELMCGESPGCHEQNAKEIVNLCPPIVFATISDRVEVRFEDGIVEAVEREPLRPQRAGHEAWERYLAEQPEEFIRMIDELSDVNVSCGEKMRKATAPRSSFIAEEDTARLLKEMQNLAVRPSALSLDQGFLTGQGDVTDDLDETTTVLFEQQLSQESSRSVQISLEETVTGQESALEIAAGSSCCELCNSPVGAVENLDQTHLKVHKSEQRVARSDSCDYIASQLHRSNESTSVELTESVIQVINAFHEDENKKKDEKKIDEEINFVLVDAAGSSSNTWEIETLSDNSTSSEDSLPKHPVPSGLTTVGPMQFMSSDPRVLSNSDEFGRNIRIARSSDFSPSIFTTVSTPDWSESDVSGEQSFISDLVAHEITSFTKVLEVLSHNPMPENVFEDVVKPRLDLKDIESVPDKSSTDLKVPFLTMMVEMEENEEEHDEVLEESVSDEVVQNIQDLDEEFGVSEVIPVETSSHTSCLEVLQPGDGQVHPGSAHSASSDPRRRTFEGVVRSASSRLLRSTRSLGRSNSRISFQSASFRSVLDDCHKTVSRSSRAIMKNSMDLLRIIGQMKSGEVRRKDSQDSKCSRRSEEVSSVSQETSFVEIHTEPLECEDTEEIRPWSAPEEDPVSVRDRVLGVQETVFLGRRLLVRADVETLGSALVVEPVEAKAGAGTGKTRLPKASATSRSVGALHRPQDSKAKTKKDQGEIKKERKNRNLSARFCSFLRRHDNNLK